MNWNQYATEQACTTRSKLALHRAVVGKITQLTTRPNPVGGTGYLSAQADNDNYPRIVGLMGYGSAGKSEVKKYLVEHRNFEGPHIKTPLANMCRSLLRDIGIPEQEVERYIDGDLKRVPIPQLGGRTSTEIQQFQGTEFGRDFCHEDLWLNMWAVKADAILANGKGVVQESVRNANEAAWIRKRGGIILDITRPGCGPINGHKSEIRPAIADAVVPNTGSIAQLHAILDDVLSGWAA